MALDCQRVERHALAADISRVSYQDAGATTYCNLPEKEAQCLAAMYAPQAGLLEHEADAVAAQSSGHHRRDSNSATEETLRLQATHERNRNASAALVLLYRIAAAETGMDNLRKQLEEVRATLMDLSRLQRAGLDVPLSVPETEAQRVEMEHKLGELELTIDLLNEQFANLLGVELPPGHRFWPDIDLNVDPNMPVVAESQMRALAQRADLGALRVAASRGGVASMRTALSQAGAGLGLATTGCKLASLFHFRAQSDETAIREKQLVAAVADKERTVRNEVAQTVATMQARLNLIVLGEQRLESLRDHREEVRRKAELPTGTGEVRPMSVFDVRKATLAELVAQQDLFGDVIEWKIAVAKRKEAEGELAIECGYMRVFEYEACGN
ncbi:MAG: TolC family protein [Planctomycetia bacterium]|nr:TolC family protein [Planctomycetia bacterium]